MLPGVVLQYCVTTHCALCVIIVQNNRFRNEYYVYLKIFAQQMSNTLKFVTFFFKTSKKLYNCKQI